LLAESEYYEQLTFAVPEYEVVHVHSLSKRSVQTVDGGGGASTETIGSLHRLKLTAFGRDVHLNLQRTEGLFTGGNVKMWTAEPNSTHPQKVEYREVPQVRPCHSYLSLLPRYNCHLVTIRLTTSARTHIRHMHLVQHRLVCFI